LHGLQILVRSLSQPGVTDQRGNVWQYHSRSDRHSKIACWGILFDLLSHCRLLATHVEERSVVFGINHEMRDFRQNRKKNLDLVLCTPRSATGRRRPFNLRSLGQKYGVVLSGEEQQLLDGLPELIEGPVGAVHLALEAKACMTAHQRAQPRLYDELNSSQLTIHGASDIAIAAGFVMVNMGKQFISPDLNKHDLRKIEPEVSNHQQPQDTVGVIGKVREIPRRGRTGEEGFDALAIAIVECRNDGTPFQLVSSSPAPEPGDTFHYEQMIRRVAQLYESRFPHA
jgi:hypothetical protein